MVHSCRSTSAAGVGIATPSPSLGRNSSSRVPSQSGAGDPLGRDSVSGSVLVVMELTTAADVDVDGAVIGAVVVSGGAVVSGASVVGAAVAGVVVVCCPAHAPSIKVNPRARRRRRCCIASQCHGPGPLRVRPDATLPSPPPQEEVLRPRSSARVRYKCGLSAR